MVSNAITGRVLAGLLVIGLGFIANPYGVGDSVQASSESQTIPVKMKRRPTDSQWTIQQTRTPVSLPGYRPGAKAISLSRYGGRTDRKAEAKGFFYTKQIGDRWWLIDPEGNLFIHIGMCSVRQGMTRMEQQSALQKFGNWQQWAEFCTTTLKNFGFNGTGGWSDGLFLRESGHPLVYVLSWDFMGDFSKLKRLVWQEPGRLGYPNMCIPVFHPGFALFCDTYAKEHLLETKDDPYLLGHFADDELPLAPDILDRSLQLDYRNQDLRYGYLAAKRWLARRKGDDATISDITEEDRAAFLEYVFEEYYKITCKAIRKYDENHLCLGSRLYGEYLTYPEVLRAAGRHIDVVAANYFGAWGPDQARLNMWAKESGKPILICEWYAKGADTGMANQSGQGLLVPTQLDRGYFYQHFTLELLENKNCIGWHWFKLRDNNPADTETDPSNRDSNKGIMNYQFEPYLPLLEKMRQINQNVYSLTDYFDQR